MYIGKRLKAIRQGIGLALLPLARAANIDVPTLSDIENNKCEPTADQLFRLSVELNTTMADLIGEESEPPGLDTCVYCGVSYHPMMRWSNGHKMICVCSPDVWQFMGGDGYPGCEEQAQAEGFYRRPESTPRR